MKYPNPIKTPGTIGLCATSAGVNKNMFDFLDRAISNVKSLGYEVIESLSVRSNNYERTSASAAVRANEFLSLYQKADCVIPVWGGEFLMEILPLFDFQNFADLPVKWISGYSDTTTLLLAITTLCDIATLHGSSFMNFGFDEFSEKSIEAFQAMALQNDYHQSSSVKFGNAPQYVSSSETSMNLVKATRYQNLNKNRTLERFEGRILSGCLDAVNTIIGSKYENVNGFTEKYCRDGTIWFLESSALSAANIYKILFHMRENGWFENTKGIVYGRVTEEYSDTFEYALTDALESTFCQLNIPVLYNADIGHTLPQLQIINGAIGHFEYQNSRAEFIQNPRA
jgi:muramoyltetrapeptide carboxypeptidase LdcA involved in peptidoglycan recycling